MPTDPLGLTLRRWINAWERLAAHHFAVGNLDKRLHDMVAAGDIAGFLGHAMERDGATRSPAGVGMGAMPGKGMVKVDFALLHRADHDLNLVSIKMGGHILEVLERVYEVDIVAPQV